MASIAFLHPDLGIGGAERLVVDAALAFKAKGYKVHFVTSHHDPTHCFQETKDGTFPVIVVGDWLPRNIFGRFYALCAYVRMLYAALYLTFFSDIRPQVVFCDIVSVCIPILKLGACKVIFYCHFPDQLLSQPGSAVKSLYRMPLNWLEEVTTGKADIIFVNSKFTSSVFKETFKSLSISPRILYPSINTSFFDESTPCPLDQIIEKQFPKDSFYFLSINRYERKKNLMLALDALNEIHSLLSDDEWPRVHLLMAGGYDTRVTENVEYYKELEEHAADLGLTEHVTFLKSPSDTVKCSLLNGVHCLIYTPANEHFGIVPLEAMYSKKPVIAANSGGPTETVVNNVTGFLCDYSSKDFAIAMQKCVRNEDLRLRLGEAGRKRVEETFSFRAFTSELADVVENLLQVSGKDE